MSDLWEMCEEPECYACTAKDLAIGRYKAELARLTNAAKSRLKCPNGHSPKDSRGACWFCDAEANAKKLENLSIAALIAQEKEPTND